MTAWALKSDAGIIKSHSTTKSTSTRKMQFMFGRKTMYFERKIQQVCPTKDQNQFRLATIKQIPRRSRHLKISSTHILFSTITPYSTHSRLIHPLSAAHMPTFRPKLLERHPFRYCLPPDDSYTNETDCRGRLLVFIYHIYMCMMIARCMKP